MQSESEKVNVKVKVKMKYNGNDDNNENDDDNNNNNKNDDMASRHWPADIGQPTLAQIPDRHLRYLDMPDTGLDPPPDLFHILVRSANPGVRIWKSAIGGTQNFKRQEILIDPIDFCICAAIR